MILKQTYGEFNVFVCKSLVNNIVKCFTIVLQRGKSEFEKGVFVLLYICYA